MKRKLSFRRRFFIFPASPGNADQNAQCAEEEQQSQSGGQDVGVVGGGDIAHQNDR